jgi:hypothetical protein
MQKNRPNDKALAKILKDYPPLIWKRIIRLNGKG